ncbi:TerB N-terminal domain-containing protein [Pyxidicoccus sp. 3LG]
MVEVAGYKLTGGMVYVGARLRAVNTPGTEPALINPSLEVGSRPSRDGPGMGYWPSYSDISPACRAAYLEWLAQGRRRPGAYIGYVFLFFYGLERRALTEMGEGAGALAEARAIEEEVQGLLQVYEENRSFRGYALAFLDVLRVRRAGDEGLLKEVPRFTLRNAGAASFDVRTAAGTAATRNLPLPADWALAWAVEASDTPLRTPATRCPDQFQALFRARYTREHGVGIIPRARKTAVKARYQPASASFGGTVHLAAASVFEASEVSLKPVRALIDDCCAALESYSRWVGKNPDGKHSMSALALLPAELASTHEGAEVQALKTTLQQSLAGKVSASVSARDLLKSWPTATPEKLSRSEAVGLAQMLEKLGYGMEPDPRMGGPVLSLEESAVIFPLLPESPSAPSSDYLGALATLHLASAVATADGTVTSEETARLEAMLETALGLLPSEKARLKAHLAWLLARPASSAGHKKRVEALTPEARTALGRLLVEVAVADGNVTPQELKTLSKLYPMLGLDEASVYAHVHTASAARPVAAAEPVPMRMAGEQAKGFTIPSPPPEEESKATRTGGVALDMRSVQAKLAESAAVSSLLGSIFAEEEVARPPPPTQSATEAGVAGLDALHTSLLRALMAKPEWPRSEVEKLAGELGLLPDGALDVINDAAFEVCGEPVIEGDETLQLNDRAAQEMVA